MKRQILFIVFLLTTLVSRAQSPSHGKQPDNSIIVKQPNAPLEISFYNSFFSPESQSKSDLHPDQITHFTMLTNVSGKAIVAIQIGFVSFDAFNGFMDSFTGWIINTNTVQKDGTEDAGWIQRPYAAFRFEKYGTGVAYVKAVRFTDGSIWRADMDVVLAELQRFEKNLKKEDLEEKKSRENAPNTAPRAKPN